MKRVLLLISLTLQTAAIMSTNEKTFTYDQQATNEYYKQNPYDNRDDGFFVIRVKEETCNDQYNRDAKKNKDLLVIVDRVTKKTPLAVDLYEYPELGLHTEINVKINGVIETIKLKFASPDCITDAYMNREFADFSEWFLKAVNKLNRIEENKALYRRLTLGSIALLSAGLIFMKLFGFKQ